MMRGCLSIVSKPARMTLAQFSKDLMSGKAEAGSFVPAKQPRSLASTASVRSDLLPMWLPQCQTRKLLYQAEFRKPLE